MKKIAVLAAAITLLVVSCKKDEKKETPIEDVKSEFVGLNIIQDSTKVNWTAYKTTDKVAVGGSFTEIMIENQKVAETVEEALEGASFSIPVSSLFTNNPERDGKLKEFFFGVLKNTEMIGGTFNFRDGKCFLTLTLNDITKQIEVASEFVDNKFTVKSDINLDDFGAQDALTSLNKVCGDLHKGADGVSKTWNEVAISGSIQFEKN